MKDTKFKYFQEKIIEHLNNLEKKEERDKRELRKAIIDYEKINKAGYPVGTVREWKGKKYIKIAPKRWSPKYDSESRGAKLSISALKKKALSCKSSQELLQMMLENKSRFSDENGYPIPIAKELSEYVSKLNDELESNVNEMKNLEDAWENKREVFTEKLKQQAISILNNPTEKMNYVEYTRENFNKLFPRGECETPLGKIKLGSHQFERLSKKDEGARSNFIGALKQTLTNPDVILGKFDIKDNKKRYSKLFLKAFTDNEGKKAYLAVVPTIDGLNILVSNSPRDTKNIIKEIKKAGFCYYIRPAKTSSVKNGGSQMENPDIGLSQNDSRKLASNSSNDSNIPQNNPDVKKKNIKNINDIKKQYQSSKNYIGDSDEIYVGNEVIQGTWKLVEADAPSASHNENTFLKTEGFPTNADGTTINDRDYEHDINAKEAVIDIANNFDGRALAFDSPIVVSQDGVIVSGNNRTMSSKLAAKKGTDKKYIEVLQKKCNKFGFTEKQLSEFEHPRVVFEIDNKGEYSTEQFAKYNSSEKKAQSPVETAVKVSKTIKSNTIESVAEKISEYDTLGELYADKKSMQNVFNSLIETGVITKTGLPAYFTNESGITNNGKEFFETVLVGSVITENNIRALSQAGGKAIRQKLVRAIIPLIENKNMDGYSVNDELNKAVEIALEVSQNREAFPNVETFAKQQDMFKKLDPVAIEFAKKLEGTQKDFAEFMQNLNSGLRVSANGELDIFLGGVESKEDIIKKYLPIKKSWCYFDTKGKFWIKKSVIKDFLRLNK